MRKHTVSEIAQLAGGSLRADGAAGAVVTAVTIDSRDAGPGSLFVALQGERTDGHAYVKPALESGAAAALVRRGTDAPGRWRPRLIDVDDPARALLALARTERRAL